MNKQNTTDIEERLSRCEDLAELKEEIIPLLHSQQDEWTEKIREILKSSGCSKTIFARLCGVSRVTLDKWCKGAIPRNREMFLRIGLAAGYNMEQINQLLQRYGRYSGLYSKQLEDCICIFVLQNDLKPTLNKYLYLLDRIKEGLVHNEDSKIESLSTRKFDEHLAEVRSEDELEHFINDNIAIFSGAYHKFYTYVKMCMEKNYQGYASSVADMAVVQGWSSSLRQCVSAIRQSKWYPTRNKIISLGLHLSLNHDQIDEMLRLAHMDPLCAGNIFESVIIYILDTASLSNILDLEAETYDPDALCCYASVIIKKLKIPEIEVFVTELPDIDEVW